MTGSVRVKGISDDSFGCEAPRSSGAYLGNAAQASFELAQEQASSERTETVALAFKADVCKNDAVTERTWSLSKPLCPDWRR